MNTRRAMIDLPADQAAREQALSPLGSFHLEAPAGSGKTSVLLARFLTLLARVEAPEELLALTFTRKAAGELRTRVMELLWSKGEPAPSPPGNNAWRTWPKRSCGTSAASRCPPGVAGGRAPAGHDLSQFLRPVTAAGSPGGRGVPGISAPGRG